MSNQRDAESCCQIFQGEVAELAEARVAAACEVVAVSLHFDVCQPIVHAPPPALMLLLLLHIGRLQLLVYDVIYDVVTHLLTPSNKSSSWITKT